MDKTVYILGRIVVTLFLMANLLIAFNEVSAYMGPEGFNPDNALFGKIGLMRMPVVSVINYLGSSGFYIIAFVWFCKKYDEAS